MDALPQISPHAPPAALPEPAEAPSLMAPADADSAYELRFDSMFIEGRGLSFPCDADGHVDIDRLSERARANYLYARAVVGREYRCPRVRREWREMPAGPRREARH